MTNDISDTWYQDFFQGINCELWEKAIPEEVTKQEVDFLLSELDLQPGQRILDIPCGFGRNAIEFSKHGFNVTGVDISQTFIEGLNKKIHSEGLHVKTIMGDILTLQLSETFDAAVCLGNSFGYFSLDKMKIFIEKVSASLAPGSKFIINSGMVAESIFPNFLKYAENKVYTVGNITMEVNNVYNANDGFMISNLHYTQEGKSEDHSYKHYVFTLAEIGRLLQSYGLNISTAYSSTAKETYKLGDPQVYIVAVKG
ncbi:MAG: methyltransferase domain-containing protein [Ginsengibacter sp.]